MDEFTKFLIIGLVIICVLLILFGGITNFAPITTHRYTYLPEEKMENVSVEYFVGYEAKEVHKTFKFSSVNVSLLKENRTFFIGNRRLYNGILFGKNDIIFHTKPLRNMRLFELRFKVIDTNRYGALVVKVNDNKIFENVLAIGEYVIPINTSYNDYVISIETTSSGLRFWSPSVYELSDIEFYFEGFTNEEKVFSFDLDYEIYKGLTKGELILNFDKFRGEAYVYINNIEVYKNNISEFFTFIPIEKNVFNPGKNTLILKAGRNAKFYGNIDLKVYYIVEGKYPFVKEFNISKNEYRDFRGRLKFRVTKVLRSGGISIKIYHNNDLLFSAYDPLEEKIYYYGLTRGDVREGKNILRIEALEDAAFHITDIEIIKM